MAFAGDYRLLVIEGPQPGRLYKLRDVVIKIGRADEKVELPGWVLLEDPTVSRLHAELQWRYENQGYLLVHRSEKNPTWVNGRSVSEAFLKIGDQIQLGGVILELERSEPSWLGPAVREPVIREKPSATEGVSPQDS